MVHDQQETGLLLGAELEVGCAQQRTLGEIEAGLDVSRRGCDCGSLLSAGERLTGRRTSALG